MKRWMGLTLLAASMMLGTAAFAQEHGGGHEAGGFHMPDGINWTTVGGTVTHTEHGREVTTPRPPPFVGPLINFGILLVLGYMAVTRSINPSLQARRAAMESEIAEAKRLHAEAQSMHDEVSTKLNALDAEIDTLKSQFVKAGEAERDRIIAEAHARAERMRAEGSAAIETELKALREDIRREAVIAAAAAAEATVRSSISADDQRRLTDEYLAGLESAGKEGAQA